MKVAILGAGLSGLACAIILERHGISPVIFEKRGQIGDRFINGEILLSILSSPIRDTISYLADHFKIYLQPTVNIRRLIMHSERERGIIQGHLGFINTRGREHNSFENQLGRQVKGEINFNSQYTYEQIIKDFSHVVMATGDAAYTGKIQDFSQDLTITINGVEVEGDFDRYSIRVWLDNRLAPKGYGYLIPLSEKKANIALSYPDSPAVNTANNKDFWDKFFERVQKDLNQNLTITRHFEITKYIIGICRYPRIGNTYFTGNCFGAIMPFLFFGQFNSILTGIFAALDICGVQKYEKSCQALRSGYQNSLVLRRAWEQFDNGKFDKFVKFFGSSLGNKIFNADYHIIKIASYLARPWIKPSTRMPHTI